MSSPHQNNNVNSNTQSQTINHMSTEKNVKYNAYV
jgi:hypothetical protein